MTTVMPPLTLMTAVRVIPSAIVSVTVHLPDELNVKVCVPVPIRLSVVAVPLGDVNTTVTAFAASPIQLSPE